MSTTPALSPAPAGFHVRDKESFDAASDPDIFDGPSHGLVDSFWTAEAGTNISLSKVPEELSPADAQALLNDLAEVLQLLNG